MLTLDAAKTLQGSAGTGTAVTYTITGMELTGTSEVYMLLAQGQLPTSTGALYTVPGGKSSFIKEVLLANTTGATVTATLYVNGAAAANQIASIPVPANGEATLDQTGWKTYSASGALLLAMPLSAAIPTAETVGGSGSAGSVGIASDAGHAHPIAALVAGDPGLYVAASTLYTSPGGTAAGTVTGANKTYVASDRGKIYLRNNSGAGMADTLPTLTNTAADIGWWVKVQNIDTVVAAAITVTTPTGTFQATGSTTMTMRYGTRQTFVWSGTQWLFDAGTINLLRVGASSVTAGDLVSFTDTDGRQTQDSGVAAANVVQKARLINTTAPLTGGGDLTADRTIAISAATISAAGSMSAADKAGLVHGSYSQVNILDFGADNLATAGSETTNATAMTNALAALPATGGVVYFPFGTYNFNTTINPGGKSVRFVGDNWAQSIIQLTHTSNDGFLMNGAWNCGLENLMISGVFTTLSGSVIAAR
jgi:hypothetical protein